MDILAGSKGSFHLQEEPILGEVHRGTGWFVDDKQ